MTPRPYLSFSQMTTIERSSEDYIKQYFYGEKNRISRNMAYGSKMAEGLEHDEMTGDPMLDLMMSKIPKFELMDKIVEHRDGMRVPYAHGGSEIYYWVPVLKDGKKDKIPLLAKPDTAKADYSAFKEYKTSVRRWTQKMADESGQITFYATAMWLATGKVPEDIELVNVEVAYQNDGSLAPTGEILRFPTKRTMVDVIKMTARMKRAWREIKQLYESELL